MKNINKVLDILEETYPDAKCELDYTTPFELCKGKQSYRGDV